MKKKDNLYILHNLTGGSFNAKNSPDAGKYRWVLSSVFTVINSIPVRRLPMWASCGWVGNGQPGQIRKPTLHFRPQTRKAESQMKKIGEGKNDKLFTLSSSAALSSASHWKHWSLNILLHCPALFELLENKSLGNPAWLKKISTEKKCKQRIFG